jgi:hypothetical protein
VDGHEVKRRAPILVGVVVLGAVAWLALHGGASSPATPRPALAIGDTSAPPAPRVAAEMPLPPAPTPVAGPAAPPAPADQPPDDPPHPHPITAQHQRMFRENTLLGEMNGALDVRDGAGLRRLLDRYRGEFPEDPSQLQEGYRIIADCLEHPGAASTAAAQRLYDVERGSTLRRFVGRHCLNNGD